jgi:hypothetical protein
LSATRWDKTITALVASCHSFVGGIKGLAKTRNAKTQSLQTGYPDISPDRYFSGSMQLTPKYFIYLASPRSGQLLTRDETWRIAAREKSLFYNYSLARR